MLNSRYGASHITPTYLIDKPSTQITRRLMIASGIEHATKCHAAYNAMPWWKRIIHRDQYIKVLGMLAMLEAMQRWTIEGEMEP